MEYHGYVYFMRPVGQEGPIKIGYSIRPRHRLTDIAQWSPLRLELFLTIDGDLELERNIQDCFADCHSHREWFHASPRLVKALKDIEAGVPVDQAIDLTKRMGKVRNLKMQDAIRRRGTNEESWVA